MEGKIQEAAEEHANNMYSLRNGKTQYYNAAVADFIEGAKSQAAKEFHTQSMYTWKEVEMMLSAFICEYCPETSSKFSPGMFINEWFNSKKK